MDSVLSKPCSLSFPLVKRYVWNLLLENSVRQTHIQEATHVEDKIDGLVLRLTTLEERFDSKPSDTEEQRWRMDVIRYAFAPLSYPMLNSSQKTGGYRTTIAVVTYAAEVAETH